jgi:hypothetical protein
LATNTNVILTIGKNLTDTRWKTASRLVRSSWFSVLGSRRKHGVFALKILVFAFAWWFGLYLLARNPARPLLRRAGFGLVAYALALVAGLLGEVAPFITAAILARVERLLLIVPAFCWSGALIQLLPEDWPFREQLDRAWAFGLLPLAAAGMALAFVTDTIFDPVNGPPAAGPGYLALGALAILALLASLILVWRTRRAARPRNAFGLLLAVGLLFSLGVAMVVLGGSATGDQTGTQATWLSWLGEWSVLGIGFDLLLLDIAIAWLDAFDEGETLLPDLIRSFAGAGFAALLFGLQVAVAMQIGAGFGLPMIALLLATIAAAIAAQVFASPLQAAIDRLAFADAPGLRRARAELRAAADALPRVDAGLDLAGMEPAEFARLTRRALSYYGDLPRLAASPLTRLPCVDARLAARAAPDDPIERATELKRLLAESIVRLKPRGDNDFGATDEWRFYNALYFPYVVGLKPYSRRTDHDHLDPTAQAALEWFQRTVPERTLHNWQNAGARLVAEQLRSESG